jgi:putative phosphoribosyl transferase
LDEIARRRALYLGKRRRAAIAEKVVIVVDDGVATGTTVRAALRAVRMSRPALLVFAVPVGPRETIIALQQEADEVICLESPAYFRAVGLYYDDFHQMTDREVIDLLNDFDRGRA